MAAFLLLVIVLLQIANLVFVMRLSRGGYRMTGSDKREIKLPRGKNKELTQSDIEDITRKAIESLELNAEESGEEETTVSAEDIAKITNDVLKNMR